MLAPGVRLFFIRHGETDWNADGRLQGGQDVPLNATGRAQATSLGLKLRGVAQHVEALPFYVSPLSRTRETAEIMRFQLGMPQQGYILEPNLRELSFGVWEGLTWKEVRAHDPSIPKSLKRSWEFTPPEGESYAMLAARVMPWLAAINSDAVVVSHGGVARVLLALVAGLARDEATYEDIWQGRVLVLSRDHFIWH